MLHDSGIALSVYIDRIETQRRCPTCMYTYLQEQWLAHCGVRDDSGATIIVD